MGSRYAAQKATTIPCVGNARESALSEARESVFRCQGRSPKGVRGGMYRPHTNKAASQNDGSESDPSQIQVTAPLIRVTAPLTRIRRHPHSRPLPRESAPSPHGLPPFHSTPLPPPLPPPPQSLPAQGRGSWIRVRSGSDPSQIRVRSESDPGEGGLADLLAAEAQQLPLRQVRVALHLGRRGGERGGGGGRGRGGPAKARARARVR